MKQQFPWFRTDSLSQALQQTLLDLDQAFSAFLEGRTGHPRKHRVEDGDRFRLPQVFEWNGQAVFLPKMGWVRCIITRPVLGRVCHATVSRDGDQWYISSCAEVSAVADTRRERQRQQEATEFEAERLAVAAGGAIGIDWGATQPHPAEGPLSPSGCPAESHDRAGEKPSPAGHRGAAGPRPDGQVQALRRAFLVVPAHHPSQECSYCGQVDRRNRPTQARFACVACGHAEHADVNAARVILARGIAQISPEAGPAFVTSFASGYGSSPAAGTKRRAA